MSRHLIVIGGGAAGFFCAVTAARLNPSLRVSIVEKTGKLLSKVRVSGGGRCNVTHACFDINEMSRSYPRGQNFVKKTFHEFFTTDTIEWFRERGVELKKEQDGRMFPVSDNSETVIRCLLNEADKYGVELLLNRDVRELEKKEGKWVVTFGNGDLMTADFVCVACGGFPKISHFDWLARLGHHIEVPVPSLFTFNIPANKITELMGIAVDARVRIVGTKWVEDGPVLITHWGLSGPAVLRLSARAARELNAMQYRFRVMVNWLKNAGETEVRDMVLSNRDDHGPARVHSRPMSGLPQRLWEFICTISGIGSMVRWAEMTGAMQSMLVKNLVMMEMGVEGKTTYKEEFVTAGGIRLNEIDHRTMESRMVQGLYFAGEIMDVDGITGGFNFQHAWTSGFIAGRAISEL
jgi:predicted Rossmann fold flavoprotein